VHSNAHRHSRAKVWLSARKFATVIGVAGALAAASAPVARADTPSNDPSSAGQQHMVRLKPNTALVPLCGWGDGHVWRTDNKDLYVRYAGPDMDDPATDPMRAAAEWALDNNYDNPTDLIVHTVDDNNDIEQVRNWDYTDECGFNWDAPQAPYFYGLTTCRIKNSAGECDVAQVRFDKSDTDTFGTTEMRSLACHEFGHAVGLVHTSTSDPDGDACMTQELIWVRSVSITFHQMDHINHAY
jgi:hypothetical protein